MQQWLEETQDPFDTGRRLPVTGMLDLDQAPTTVALHCYLPEEYRAAIKNRHLKFKTGEQVGER